MTQSPQWPERAGEPPDDRPDPAAAPPPPGQAPPPPPGAEALSSGQPPPPGQLPPPGQEPPPFGVAGPAPGGGPSQPLYPGSAYATPAAGPPGYGYGYYAPPRRTNGMAIASMVVSIVGAVALTCYFVPGIIGAVGAVLGHVAQRQIRDRDEGGGGMALAGIIVGWIAVGLAVLGAIFFVVVFAVSATSSGFAATM